VRNRPTLEFQVHRIYEAGPGPGPAGWRVLVDRLWPRGIKKADAALDEWLKDAAPSADLRRWYGHDPSKFDEFARRYRDELGRPPAADAIEHLRSLARDRPVMLLTATRDVEHSGARVLYAHLTGHETSDPSGSHRRPAPEDRTR
jgi:uncharacterized protein YeaO (DUF488 family)